MKHTFIILVLMLLISYAVWDVANAPGGASYIAFDYHEEPKVTLAFTGDIMLGRNVEVLMERYGHEYPFASTSELFDKADFIIANLEGPIPDDHVHTQSGDMSFSFPSYAPEVLHDAGVNAVSLANNHTFDKGADIYEETAQNLRRARVDAFGNPLLQQVSYMSHYALRGIEFSLLGFNATYPSFTLSSAVQAVSEARALYPDSTIIAFMHWGTEYEQDSNAEQKKIADALHDAGADLVIGSHPHVTQELACEGISRCTIFSLGNFIFDQYFSKEVEQGLVAYVTLGKAGIEGIEIVPVEGHHSQPRIMARDNGFLQTMLERSRLNHIELSTSSASLILKGE